MMTWTTATTTTTSSSNSGDDDDDDNDDDATKTMISGSRGRSARDFLACRVRAPLYSKMPPERPSLLRGPSFGRMCPTCGTRCCGGRSFRHMSRALAARLATSPPVRIRN